MLRNISYILYLFFIVQCQNSDENHPHHTSMPNEVYSTAAVVCAHPEAALIGKQILEKGGNAFDAMIAVQFALAVVYPRAGNLAGGGFMVYRTHEGDRGSLDFREKAPALAHENMFLNDSGVYIPSKSAQGALSVAVPGSIAGIFAAYEKFGTLPFYELITPAIELAKRGVILTSKQAIILNKYQDDFSEVNRFQIPFVNESGWIKGDTLLNIDLAHTLERIRRDGREEFYQGETSWLIYDEIQALGGVMTRNDLHEYSVEWRPLVEFYYKNLFVYSMAPPSSGGITLGQIMGMLEHYPIRDFGHNTSKSIQLITETERRAFEDRSIYLGDPDFNEMPVEKLLDKSYLLGKMASYLPNRASKSKINTDNIPNSESFETTHFSIIDKDKNAVSVTTTLNGNFGSKVYVHGGGFFLNNEMDDFNMKDHKPNQFGLVGLGKANKIEPNKRMLSSMTPTIVEKNNKLWMVLGTPGGPTIITSVLQTILNVYEYNMTMQEAVTAHRFHHQWLPDEIQLEKGIVKTKIEKKLMDMGYKLNYKEYDVNGKVDAIKVLENGKLETGADPRGDDVAEGY